MFQSYLFSIFRSNIVFNLDSTLREYLRTTAGRLDGMFQKGEINVSRNQKRFKSILRAPSSYYSKMPFLLISPSDIGYAWSVTYTTREQVPLYTWVDGLLAHPVWARCNGVVSVAAWRARAHTRGRSHGFVGHRQAWTGMRAGGLRDGEEICGAGCSPWRS